MIYFVCTACGQRLKTADAHAGRSAPCRCGAEVVIPAAKGDDQTGAYEPVRDDPTAPHRPLPGDPD